MCGLVLCTERDAQRALSVPNETRSARRRSCGAERDAQRAPSGLRLREVAHMSEMRKNAAFLWERHALEEVGFWLRRHTEPRVSDGMPPRTWRGEGALQRAGARGEGALQRANARDKGALHGAGAGDGGAWQRGRRHADEGALQRGRRHADGDAPRRLPWSPEGL